MKAAEMANGHAMVPEQGYRQRAPENNPPGSMELDANVRGAAEC